MRKIWTVCPACCCERYIVLCAPLLLSSGLGQFTAGPRGSDLLYGQLSDHPPSSCFDHQLQRSRFFINFQVMPSADLRISKTCFVSLLLFLCLFFISAQSHACFRDHYMFLVRQSSLIFYRGVAENNRFEVSGSLSRAACLGTSKTSLDQYHHFHMLSNAVDSNWKEVPKNSK